MIHNRNQTLRALKEGKFYKSYEMFIHTLDYYKSMYGLLKYIFSHPRI